MKCVAVLAILAIALVPTCKSGVSAPVVGNDLVHHMGARSASPTPTGETPPTDATTIDAALTICVDLMVSLIAEIVLVLNIVVSIMISINIMLTVVIFVAVVILDIFAKCSKSSALASVFFLSVFLEVIAVLFSILAIVLKFGVFLQLSVLFESFVANICQITGAVAANNFLLVVIYLETYIKGTMPQYGPCGHNIQSVCAGDPGQCIGENIGLVAEITAVTSVQGGICTPTPQQCSCPVDQSTGDASVESR